jgi:membrane protein YdbS with pleckstrin-like domain
MKCERCGAEVVAQSVYCHKCGHRVGQSAGAALQQPTTKPEPPADPDKTIWDGSYSPKAMYGTYIVCAVLSLAIVIGGAIFFAPFLPLAIGLAVLIWLWPVSLLLYQRFSVHYRLTPQRFFHERGILKRVTDRIEVIDMDDITTEQGIIERMLGVGTLRITSSDRTHPKLVLPGIDNVARVAELIDDARRSERNRRGVYIESV